MYAAPAADFQPGIIDTATERLLQFSGHALQSRMRLEDPAALLVPYTRQMMSFLLFTPDPTEVLMIGLGGGSMAKFSHRHLAHTRVIVVEIDAQVIGLRNAFQIPADDARLQVVHDDGALYLQRLGGTVDTVLIDAFDAQGVSPTLSTAAFYQEVRRCLTPQGTMIMNLHGDPTRHPAHVKQAQAAFDGRVMLVPVTGSDNVLLCAFGSQATPLHSRCLDMRAAYLQSALRLNFSVYLRRLRDASAAGGLV